MSASFIGALRGTLLWRSGSDVLVEAAGVGYRVTVFGSRLPSTEVGQELFLHIHHQVREDAQLLFGFADIDGRDTFETLLAAHGVGPALAGAILTALSPDQLAQSVHNGDVDRLCAVPGVGKKTAQRLIVELRGKLELVPEGSVSSGPSAADDEASDAITDVRLALAELGYSNDEIARATSGLSGEDSSALLRASLARLG